MATLPDAVQGETPVMSYSIVEETSPLKYDSGLTHRRLSAVDENAPPPGKYDSYFAQQERLTRHSPSGRTLRKPRVEITPGASSPQVVGFVDFSFVRGFLYIAYLKVRQDYRGKGLASFLVKELVRRHPQATHIDFGKIMQDPIMSIYEKMKREHEQGRGPSVVGKDWTGGPRRVAQRFLRSSSWKTPEAAMFLRDTEENRSIAWKKTGPYWTNAEKIVLYHGTTVDKLQSIEEHGLKYGNLALDFAYAAEIAKIRREGFQGVVFQVEAPPGHVYPVFHGPKLIRTDSLAIAKPIRNVKLVRPKEWR